MPTRGRRAAHNKTRLGCGPCKKRRIKCDENYPSCQNCDKRSLTCSFLLLVPTSRLSSLDIPRRSSRDENLPEHHEETSHLSEPSLQASGSAASTALIPIPSRLPPTLRLKDGWEDFKDKLTPYHRLLFNHYEYTTCFTLATDGPAQTAWHSSVLEMASEHKYLVPSLLSVTSLHLARLHDSKEEKDHMHSIAASQMNEALSHFRADLGKIHERNAAALFACSTLTAVYFFRTSTLEWEEIRASIVPDTCMNELPTQLTDKMIQPFLKTIRGVRGVISVLTPGYNWVTGGDLSPLCTRPWWPKVFMPTTERALDEDRRLAELAKLWKNSDQIDATQSKCLTEALMYLRQTFALVSLLTDPSEDYNNPQHDDAISYSVDDTSVGLLKDRAAIFLWATQISNEFVSMVEQRNREALVLVAHYAVLFGRIRNVWWMDGFGAQTIWAIAMVLGRDEQHLIDWPVQAVGVDLGVGGPSLITETGSYG